MSAARQRRVWMVGLLCALVALLLLVACGGPKHTIPAHTMLYANGETDAFVSDGSRIRRFDLQTYGWGVLVYRPPMGASA